MASLVDRFALSTESVVEMHDKIFHALDYGEDGSYENSIEVCEWLDRLKEKRSQYTVWLLEACNCPSPCDEISFDSFLEVVATFCMFGKDELVRSLFGFGLKKHQVMDQQLFW